MPAELVGIGPEVRFPPGCNHTPHAVVRFGGALGDQPECWVDVSRVA